jgi:iron complex outermembrane recepter protein
MAYKIDSDGLHELLKMHDFKIKVLKERKMKPLFQNNYFRGLKYPARAPGIRRPRESTALALLGLGLGAIEKAVRALCLISMAATVWAQKPGADLTKASLEDLMDIEVTSVSKKEEKLFQTAAAIYVITQEDIRRSGLTSIPELLRMAPGLSVARIDGNKWAISARGFNSRFANKLLVLIDGRSVYSPLFSGVFWETQDLVLEDVERIEVIRGPGATLWGANAVNGVINIITKHTKDTQGGLLTAGIGTEEQGFGSLRFGGKLGENAYYRLYAKYFNRGKSVDFSGQPAADRWDALRGGFRIDWQASAKDSLTLQGDIYDGGAGQRINLFWTLPPFTRTLDDRINFAGGNVNARWNRATSDRSDMAIQTYYDHTKREEAYFGEGRDTFNVEFQNHLALGQRQDIVWGLGYRVTWDHLSERPSATFIPQKRTDNLFSGFWQHEFLLVPKRLRLTLGSKLEHNNYTGFEVQPNALLLWTPHDRHTVWSAVSRAVRTPSRIEDDLQAPYQVLPGAGGIPNVVTVFGNRDYKSETLIAYELGYRVRPADKLSLDIASFYNSYRRLRTAVPGVPYFAANPFPPRVVIPLILSNQLQGESYGTEITANWNVIRNWKLSTGYTFIRVQLHAYPGSPLPIGSENGEGNSPRHQAQIHSYLTLPHNLELDTALYRVNRLNTGSIPGYTRLDARFGWRLTESFNLSIGVQNLLAPRHPEFGETNLGETLTQSERGVYGKLTWRFR